MASTLILLSRKLHASRARMRYQDSRPRKRYSHLELAGIPEPLLEESLKIGFR
jgi:hypothetical protein